MARFSLLSITGLGVGIASGVPSVLLSEIATPESRGVITTLHQLGITTGILIASLLGYGMVTYVNHGWQYIQVTTQSTTHLYHITCTHPQLHD